MVYSAMYSTIKMEMICFSEMSAHMQATLCYISKKMATFISTGVRTSDSTRNLILSKELVQSLQIV
jgi:hypothetical protein